MNAISNIVSDPLARLREPFLEHQISKLPKPTKAQTDAVKADFKQGVRCEICGTWHHPKVVHLDYVGHAAATDRLLDADPRWTWDPVPDPASLGLPTTPGGMWIKLTVDGVSRYGFGCADGKTGGDAVKEIIGDAIRNAGMRFGMALDLWHKGDLHLADEPEAPAAPESAKRDAPAVNFITENQRIELMSLATAKNIDARSICEVGRIASIAEMPADRFARARKWVVDQPKRELGDGRSAQASDIIDDDIQY